MIEAGGGSIVCVGTRAALQPFPGAAGYISSKAAVIAFAHAVAVEYKDDGVRCNAILPSVIDTPANRASMPKADHEKWVKPAEIAGVIAYLLGRFGADQRRGDPGLRARLGLERITARAARRAGSGPGPARSTDPARGPHEH